MAFLCGRAFDTSSHQVVAPFQSEWSSFDPGGRTFAQARRTLADPRFQMGGFRTTLISQRHMCLRNGSTSYM